MAKAWRPPASDTTTGSESTQHPADAHAAALAVAIVDRSASRSGVAVSPLATPGSPKRTEPSARSTAADRPHLDTRCPFIDASFREAAASAVVEPTTGKRKRAAVDAPSAHTS